MILIGIMIILVISTTEKVSSISVAKSGCKDRCGNVTIPFPFGIGSDCYADKWFEIQCDNSSSPSRPFLKQSKLEVLNITYIDGNSERSFQVRNPTSFYNCPEKEQPQPLNLTGKPFYFYNNIFVAVSCGIVATLNSSLEKNNLMSGSNDFSAVWCKSTCSTENISNSLCNGIDCCESFPSSIYKDNLEISFDDTSIGAVHDNGGCKFAFLVDYEYWTDYKNRSTNFTAIRDQGSVPLSLLWQLNYSHFDILKRNVSYINIVPGMTQYCYDYPVNCYCNSGFQGNPYILNGCEDINECEEYDISCGLGGTCVNKYGGYDCSFKHKFIFISFGSSVGALLLIFGTWGLYKRIKKIKEIRRRKFFFKQNGGLLLQQQLSSEEGNIKKTKLFTSNELTKATDHFSTDRILGQGGQGTVYKGMLEDGKIVAIKKSKVIDEEKLSEFINEVVILSQINHRNVVQLLGCCLETEVPILVYEFIPNGTLCQYIHEQNEAFPFTWKIRLRIATEVAGALSYLHSAASFPIYHRDIKSTNILLDQQYRAKVADFGTSRTISVEQTHVTTLVYGTFGYLDPEYFQSSQFTEKSDVYSFGVVLVELLTGQKAICATRAEERRNLATFFTMSMESNCLLDIVDAKALEDGPKDEILIVACLALRCLSLSGRNRPTMKEVALELEGLQKPNKEAPSDYQQNYEELAYVRTELYEPWDVSSMSTGSSAFDNMTIRPSLQQELPLLSFKSK